MEKKKADTFSSMQIVCFKIGNEDYGIEILKVQEILKLPKITELPKTVGFIMGVIDLRGKVLPVVALGKRFDIEASDISKSQKAIVVNIKEKEVALAIDSVSSVAKVDSKDIEPPPPIVKGISGRYIVGIAKIDEDFIVILDIDQIFSSDEISVIEQIK